MLSLLLVWCYRQAYPVFRIFLHFSLNLGDVHILVLEDDSTCLAVITSVQLARELGIRFEGDIVMYIPKGCFLSPITVFSTIFYLFLWNVISLDYVFQWPFTSSRTAESIIEWVRGKRAEVAPIRWIHFSWWCTLASFCFFPIWLPLFVWLFYK